MNATKNNDIEQIGLPRIYYTGPILKNYNAIAMTLFDGTLENYFKQHKSAGKLPDSSILEIFRQTVFQSENQLSLSHLTNYIKYYYRSKY